MIEVENRLFSRHREQSEQFPLYTPDPASAIADKNDFPGPVGPCPLQRIFTPNRQGLSGCKLLINMVLYRFVWGCFCDYINTSDIIRKSIFFGRLHEFFLDAWNFRKQVNSIEQILIFYKPVYFSDFWWASSQLYQGFQRIYWLQKYTTKFNKYQDKKSFLAKN